MNQHFYLLIHFLLYLLNNQLGILNFHRIFLLFLQFYSRMGLIHLNIPLKEDIERAFLYFPNKCGRIIKQYFSFLYFQKNI